ncbi:ABC transporter transmembrane domain-containing protein, partial [uncultured Nocardioides sp.]
MTTESRDAPQAAGVHSLWRLRGYLRPYVWSLSLMLVASLGGVALAIGIPLVTRAIIDGPITERDLSALWPLAGLALLLGVTEAFLVWMRRWVQSAAVLGLETTMRRDLYARLQELPMAFHGHWQSGQLLSRATTDLSAIRRFSGFGLLFLLINVVQLTATTVVLLHMYWPLGLVV